MEKIQTKIIYIAEIVLDIKEDSLPYIRFAIIARPMGEDKLVTLAEDYWNSIIFPEIDYNIINISFKKISTSDTSEKYKIYVNIGFYIETDKQKDYPYSFDGNPINLMVLIYYLNNKGRYESKKYSI
ncbi:MAG: hypothetical protein V1901_03870 [Patescibacteria group bacterium]